MNGGMNTEGYNDPTANIAIGRLYKQEQKRDRLLQRIRDIAHSWGYEVVTIVIRKEQ